MLALTFVVLAQVTPAQPEQPQPPPGEAAAPQPDPAQPPDPAGTPAEPPPAEPAPPAEPEPPAPEPAAPPPAADAKPETGFLALLASKINIYGFVRLDVDIDDSRPNNVNTIGFVLSEDPAATTGARKNDGSFSMHPKLTRFGLALDAGEVESIGAKVGGKIEIDFYNATLSMSRSAIRMRLGFVQLQWSNFSILAGQDWDTISPLNPTPNNDLMMWGAGNLADRRPQIRPEVTLGPLKISGSVGITGAVDNQDLDMDTLGDGEASGLPTLQGRIGVSVPGFAAETKIEGGVWGHRAWEQVATPVGTSDEFDSWAAGLDLKLPFLAVLWVQGEAWMGKNLDDVRGGIFQGINGSTGKEIRARGGWAELGVKPVPWWSPSLGISIDQPEEDDIGDGARKLNRIFYVANRLEWAPVQVGIDYLFWETQYKALGKGTDNRFNVFVAYKY